MPQSPYISARSGKYDEQIRKLLLNTWLWDKKLSCCIFSSNLCQSHGSITDGAWTSHFHGLNRSVDRSFMLTFKKEVFLGWTDTHTCAFLCPPNVDLTIDGHLLLPFNQDFQGRQFEGSIPNLLIKAPMPRGKFWPAKGHAAIRWSWRLGSLGVIAKPCMNFIDGVAQRSRYLADLLPEEKCVGFEKKKKQAPWLPQAPVQEVLFQFESDRYPVLWMDHFRPFVIL